MRAPTDELVVIDYNACHIVNGELSVDALFTVTGGGDDKSPRWGTLQMRCDDEDVARCTVGDVIRESWYFVDWHASERVARAAHEDDLELTTGLL